MPASSWTDEHITTALSLWLHLTFAQTSAHTPEAKELDFFNLFLSFVTASLLHHLPVVGIYADRILGKVVSLKRLAYQIEDQFTLYCRPRLRQNQ